MVIPANSVVGQFTVVAGIDPISKGAQNTSDMERRTLTEDDVKIGNVSSKTKTSILDLIIFVLRYLHQQQSRVVLCIFHDRNMDKTRTSVGPSKAEKNRAQVLRLFEALA